MSRVLVPTYSSWRLDLAYRIHLRGRCFAALDGEGSPGGVPRGWFILSRLMPWNWVSTFCHDRYAMYQVDTLITGADVRLALLVAVLRAQAGERVLLLPGAPEAMDEGSLQARLMAARFDMDTPALAAAVRALVMLPARASLFDALVEAAVRLNEDTPRIVVLTEGEFSTDARLNSDCMDGDGLFFEDRKHARHARADYRLTDTYLGPATRDWHRAIDHLPLLRPSATHRHVRVPGTRGGYESLVLRARQVVKTSFVQASLGQHFARPVITLGDAERPIGSFRQFTPMHRLMDYARAIAVQRGAEDDITLYRTLQEKMLDAT